jgi:hypothetical protein
VLHPPPLLTASLLPLLRGVVKKTADRDEHSMGEHARYVDQDGVNVFLVHVDIADPQETADVENNLLAQLYDLPSPHPFPFPPPTSSQHRASSEV